MQTIRYCVAITDVLCILPIARAVYLPLAQFEHDCFANTSIVFHKNQLKLFYLPKNKLDEKSLQSLENKIGVPFKKLNSKDDSKHCISSDCNYAEKELRNRRTDPVCVEEANERFEWFASRLLK